jgi:hypothetical protein
VKQRHIKTAVFRRFRYFLTNDNKRQIIIHIDEK